MAHANQSRILSLPIYAEMTDEMIAYVVGQIKRFFAHGRTWDGRMKSGHESPMRGFALRAAGILDHFGPEDLIYFELGDADDLAAKIEYVFRQPEVVDRTVRRGQKAYRDHSWHLERSRFVHTLAEVLGVAGPPPGQERAAEPAPTKGDP